MSCYHNSLLISFYNCCDTSQQVISVHGTESAAYIFSEQAARKLTHWITVTAMDFCREFVRAVIRIFCDLVNTAFFNRNVFSRTGGLRL